MRETEYGRRNRLRAEGRSFALGMYGWNHPANVMPARDIPSVRSLWDYCRLLEQRLRALEAAADRQRAADVAELASPQTIPLPTQADTLVIRRRGEGGRHAS